MIELDNCGTKQRNKNDDMENQHACVLGVPLKLDIEVQLGFA